MNWPPAHEQARQEFGEAVAYLTATGSNHLARRFILKAMDTVRRARRFPESGSKIGRHARRMQIAPFSYDFDLYARGRRHPHHRDSAPQAATRILGGTAVALT